jgi:hypothetical protein
VSSAFMKLFSFISGSNSLKQKIPMTAPVISLVEPGSGPNCVSNFTVSFFLPLNMQEKPLSSLPSPMDQTVFLEAVPSMTVAVRSFGGFAGDSDVASNAAALAQDLLAAGNKFSNATTYFTAGYSVVCFCF